MRSIAPVMLSSNDNTDSMNAMNIVYVVNTPEGQEDIINTDSSYTYYIHNIKFHIDTMKLLHLSLSIKSKSKL